MKLRKTITSIFLVPKLGIDKSILRTHNYLNGYSDFKNKPLDYDNHVVYLLFRPDSPYLFQKFIDNQYQDNSLLEDFNLDHRLVVLVYKLPEQFDSDYLLIKQSKYSKTSKKFKDSFPDTVKIEKEGAWVRRRTLQRMIFDKDVALSNYWQDKIGTYMILDRDMEVWNSFEMNEETLNIDEIVKEITE